MADTSCCGMIIPIFTSEKGKDARFLAVPVGNRGKALDGADYGKTA
jgi:hypothetical protein